MKKNIFFTVAVLISMGRAVADEVIIGDVTIPQGGQAIVGISLTNTDNTYTAGQMLLVLPSGVTAVLNDNSDPMTTKGERLATTNHAIGASHLEDGTEQFTIFSVSNDEIPDNDGILFSICVTADTDLAVGTMLEGKLERIEMTTTDATPAVFNSQTFTITIGEPADSYVLLDENATELPVAEEGVDVRVRRTFVADEWTTVCLPFAMTEMQTKEAFGEGVMLADFTRWTSEEDEEGDIVRLNLYFETVRQIEANHPDMISVMEDMTEFTVNGVNIAPVEEPTVQVGKKKAERDYMIGSYTVSAVPEGDIAISDGQFAYSNGTMQTKAFRAWFELADELADKDNCDVRLYIDDRETSVRDLHLPMPDGTVYDLAGHRVVKTGKGIYIIGGKKQAVF